MAISQMTPGPIGINSATYVGYTTIAEQYGTSMGVLGSCIATFAVVLPSFILMLTISKFFLKYQKHPSVEAVFSGLRPAVVGLLASAALVLMNAENFSSPNEDMYSFIISIIIFLVAFIGTRKYKANPILMIIACGIAGLILYWHRTKDGYRSRRTNMPGRNECIFRAYPIYGCRIFYSFTFVPTDLDSLCKRSSAVTT